MKRLLLCVLLALGVLGQSAAAQAVAKEQQSAASVVAGDGTSDNATAVVRGWNRPYVSFNASKVNSSVNDLLDFDLRGFTLGWLRGFGIAKKVPLYLEAGAGLQFRTMKEGIDMADGSDVASLDTRINLLSAHPRQPDLQVYSSWRTFRQSLRGPRLPRQSDGQAEG